MDSQGESVSSDSVRDSNECRGFTCGAYELLLMPISAATHFTYVADFAGEPPSVSVAVSAIECRWVFEAVNCDLSSFKRAKFIAFTNIYRDFCH